MTTLNYCEYQPAACLSQFVEGFWSIETLTATDTGVPPDGCVDIVFSPSLGLRAVGL
jgi:hypothetical protein